MEKLILKRIAGLITSHAGIQVREQDYARLSDILRQRCHQCGLRSLEDYADLLIKELTTVSQQLPLGTPASTPPPEWSNLFAQLTVNESYFFRDRNQFNLLTQRLLPEIIQRKQQQHQQAGRMGLPSLRIWSAGCSTGEELYSIAIALHELNFPWGEWQTLLLGTDISLTALAIAQQGIYSNWSFRQTEPAIQNRYFRLRQQALQVRDDVRQQVTFQYGNLVSDRFPAANSPLRDIDLILCRNVFIYFDQAAIARTLQKFHHTLAPEGLLITGHTELYGQDMQAFQFKIFPESLVYQRRTVVATDRPITVLPKAAAPPAITPPRPSELLRSRQQRLTPRPSSSTRPAASPPAVDPDIEPAAVGLLPRLQTAQHSLETKAYGAAIREAIDIQAAHPEHFTAHLILAKAYANTGNHPLAKQWCQSALRLRPQHIEVHYLLAQIAEEEQDLDAAKAYLRRIIYLDAREFRAYLDLASLYHQENRPDQVQKMQQLALKTLRQLPNTAIVDSDRGLTVSDWQQHLETQLSQD